MNRRFPKPLAAIFFAAIAWAGQENQIALKWNELAPRIMEKKVALVLPGGTAVEGKVRGVEADHLLLDISKTSDKHVQPKGLQSIPRQSVSVLRITEYHKLGRILATTGAIAVAGSLTALSASSSELTEGPAIIIIPAVGAAGTAGLGVAGYYFGKAIDKRVDIIRVVPGN